MVVAAPLCIRKIFVLARLQNPGGKRFDTASCACPCLSYKVIGINTDATGTRYLTHWGREKMASILQTIFQMYLLGWKYLNVD